MIVIVAYISVWLYARPMKVEWRNIPPPPSTFGAHATGLGDAQLSYRMIGFMLQNIAGADTRSQSLKSYNYADLKEWFFRGYHLDTRAVFIPALAAYYYGATTDPAQARYVIEFLRVAGNDPARGRWRWLAHSIFLAQHKVKDLNLAYELAEILQRLNTAEKPAWADMMPAMIKNSKGEKEDAYIMLKTMLETSSESLDPTEINNLVAYICEQNLTKEQASKDPICNLKKP